MVISRYLCAYVHSLTGPESLQSSFINSRHIKITKKVYIVLFSKISGSKGSPHNLRHNHQSSDKKPRKPRLAAFLCLNQNQNQNQQQRVEKGKISNEEKTKKKSATKTWGGKTCCRRRAAPTQAICSTSSSTWSKVFFQHCLLSKVFVAKSVWVHPPARRRSSEAVSGNSSLLCSRCRNYCLHEWNFVQTNHIVSEDQI